MKVFISWSGDRSLKTAESLRSWLRDVIQSVEPFVSAMDIAKGDRGLRVIASELEQTSFGIVCVTRENSLAPWINFEAGALSKAVGEASVVPFLLDMPISDLTGPLAQFQVVSSINKEDVFAMVKTLRDHAKLADLDDARLRRYFDVFWPQLDAKLEVVRAGEEADHKGTPVRTESEILEEVLVLTRRQETVLRTIAERVDSSQPMLEIKAKAGGPRRTEDDRRLLVDELVTILDMLGDTALGYRFITDRDPEELQIVFESGAITQQNADEVGLRAREFVLRKNVHLSVRSKDGYEIIAGPGKKVVLLPPPGAGGE